MKLTFPNDRMYHAEHLWAKEEADGECIIGISDFAQNQLESVIFIDMPAVGDYFAQGTSCASIESVKVTSDAIMPRSGTIIAINEALFDAPELLNSDPYEGGWLVRVKLDKADEVKTDKEVACMTAAAYQELIS